MTPLNVLSLFAGIGGLELGLERAGMNTVAQVEIDPHCRRVLAKHWPNVPQHDDVRTAADWWQSTERPTVDVICGGFPCQDISFAGLGAGLGGARSGLWFAMADTVRRIRPRYVLIENVAALRTRGLNRVLSDLAALGFDAEWSVVSACSVGAPHTRERMFILAHPASERGIERRGVKQSQDGYPQRHVHHWQEVPEPHRVVDGIPGRMDRLRGLGNAVVPQVAEHVGRLIVAAHAEHIGNQLLHHINSRENVA